MEGINDEIIRAFLKEKTCGVADKGYGSGLGDGLGDGSGDGSGSGSGWGLGDGSGSGWGLGCGLGWVLGDGSGSGSGWGLGDGSCSGSGLGDGSGIRSFGGDTVYNIDGVPTTISRICGNVARGAILNRDFTITPTVVVRDGVNFAHGRTIREAEAALVDKRLSHLDPEERIEEFVKAFPDVDAKVSHEDLFAWHSRITGSCEAGRLAFCKAHGIDPRHGEMTVRAFILLTKDTYGAEIIRKIAKKYGIKVKSRL